jgi:hypothetical protein
VNDEGTGPVRPRRCPHCREEVERSDVGCPNCGETIVPPPWRAACDQWRLLGQAEQQRRWANFSREQQEMFLSSWAALGYDKQALPRKGASARGCLLAMALSVGGFVVIALIGVAISPMTARSSSSAKLATPAPPAPTAATRLVFAAALRDAFLDQGFDIKVSTQGPDARELRLEYPLFNDVWIHHFQKSGMSRQAGEAGFRSVEFRGAFDYDMVLTYQ